MSFVGVPAQQWLYDPRLAMPSLIIIMIWSGLGSNMIIFLAGLQEIPEEIYEAAKVDGAVRWQSFLFITVPLLRPVILFEVMLLPVFLLIRQFPLVGGNDLLGHGGIGLLNSYGGLIFPNMISVYGVFLFRQFFLGFPVEIEDAARIDGSSRARFFWTILLPNARPVIGTMGLFAFLWTWNDFLWPLVVIKDSAMNTLQIGIASFNQEFETRWAELMAASMMATVPVIILFLILQRFLVKGVATSGIKG